MGDWYGHHSRYSLSYGDGSKPKIPLVILWCENHGAITPKVGRPWSLCAEGAGNTAEIFRIFNPQCYHLGIHSRKK